MKFKSRNTHKFIAILFYVSFFRVFLDTLLICLSPTLRSSHRVHLPSFRGSPHYFTVWNTRPFYVNPILILT